MARARFLGAYPCKNLQFRSVISSRLYPVRWRNPSLAYLIGQSGAVMSAMTNDWHSTLDRSRLVSLSMHQSHSRSAARLSVSVFRLFEAAAPAPGFPSASSVAGAPPGCSSELYFRFMLSGLRLVAFTRPQRRSNGSADAGGDFPRAL